MITPLERERIGRLHGGYTTFHWRTYFAYMLGRDVTLEETVVLLEQVGEEERNARTAQRTRSLACMSGGSITPEQLRILACLTEPLLSLRQALLLAAETIEALEHDLDERDKDIAVFEEQIVDMQRQHCGGF